MLISVARTTAPSPDSADEVKMSKPTVLFNWIEPRIAIESVLPFAVTVWLVPANVPS
jgi:hypothetical protein